MNAPGLAHRPEGGGSHHDALLYHGEREFLAATAIFTRAGLAVGEPTLIAVTPDKIEALTCILGCHTEQVEFLNVEECGRNPARLTSLWLQFVDAHPGQALRGIGEPMWPGRTHAELVECAGHESLLNTALDTSQLWLLCPYDVAALQPDDLAAARRTHPHLIGGGEATQREASAGYRHTDSGVLSHPLPEPAGLLSRLPFGQSLAGVRQIVAERAAAAGLGRDREEDLLLAVTEAASNSVRHGGGRGVLRVWQHNGALVCEIHDAGRITEPLAGHLQPPSHATSGRGLWMANQLCDLVQLRSTDDGTIVRLPMTAA